MSEEKIQKALEPFLNNNPKVKLEKIVIGDDEVIVAKSPWGDASLVLVVPDDFISFSKLVESIILPERLSAIFHKETNSLEVIWTAFKLTKQTEELKDRTFTFRYSGKSYKCEFSKSSDVLLELAKAARPVGPTSTGYRNIQSFSSYTKYLDNSSEEHGSRYDSPRCFWIHNIKLSEDDLLEFLRNLNFYMTYYDSQTPYVIIHPPADTEKPTKKESRYRLKKFPKKIISKPIERDILHFWAASEVGEPASQFLYGYRIIEHAAFSYIENKHKVAVKRILRTPHAFDNIDDIVADVILAVKASKLEKRQKFQHIVCGCVDPSSIWEIVEIYMDSFSSEQKFDGGFLLKPLVASKSSGMEFCNSGLISFCNMATDIRNALSHGKESKSAAVISPTKENQSRLIPWAVLMKRVAGEVILYKDIS